MKKMITTLCLSLFLVAGLFAQVAAADVEKAYTILEASDDAAQANWGGSWRMPTITEFTALGTATTSAWTADYEGSGVAGLVFTSKADSSKKLFFPASGYCSDGSMADVGRCGYYWSSLLYSDDFTYAHNLYFAKNSMYMDGDSIRSIGYLVRGVAD